MFGQWGNQELIVVTMTHHEADLLLSYLDDRREAFVSFLRERGVNGTLDTADSIRRGLIHRDRFGEAEDC